MLQGNILKNLETQLIKLLECDILPQESYLAGGTAVYFYFPYTLLSKIHSYPVKNNKLCPIASLDDLEAMKAIAISQRGSIKDFIDLYFLLNKTGHCFNDIVELVSKKYKIDRYEYQLKTSFVYFDDAEREYDSIIMIKENNRNEKIKMKEWKEIKSFFYGFTK